MSFSQLYFSFDGRIGRQTYWVNGVLTFAAVGAVVGFFDAVMEAEGVLITILMMLLVLPSLALQAKRWHDRDKSGWWALVAFIPIIGSIWSLVELGFLEGTPGDNRYGADPLFQQRSAGSLPLSQTIAPAPVTVYTNSSTAQAHNLQSTVSAKLNEAKRLNDSGVLSDEEYGDFKRKILQEA